MWFKIENEDTGTGRNAGMSALAEEDKYESIGWFSDNV